MGSIITIRYNMSAPMNYHDHTHHSRHDYCHDGRGGNYGGYDNNHHGQTLNAIHDVATTGLSTSAAATASIIAENERVAFAMKDSMEKQSVANRDAIERTGAANSVATERIGSANSVSIERNGLANLTATERNATALGLSVERTTGDIRHSQQQIAGETRGLMYQHSTQHLLTSKDILVEMTKNACHVERQASDNYAAIQLEAAKNKASLELEALKNKEVLAAQLAQCCCEIKESILSSASTTQLLIRDTESNRVRDALAASATENLILRLSGGNGGGNGNGKN